MQGKRQWRCVDWITNWALQIHCNPKVILVWINWYQRIKQREITKGYRGYMEFDIAFVSWVKVLLDLLKLSNFFSLYPVVPKMKIICFLFQRIKNDWVLRRFFEKYITILSVLVDVKGDFFSISIGILQAWLYF